MNTPHVPKVRVRAARTADQSRPSEPIGDTSNSHRATLTLKANAVARNLVRHIAPQTTSGAASSKASLPERARWSAANGR